MKQEFDKSLQNTKEHLAYMMWQEKSSGEFLLASVVADSLLYNLNHHADSPELSYLAYETAKLSVQTAAEAVYLNEFTVCESVRGVMHTIVLLGGDLAELTGDVMKGAFDGVKAACGDDECAGKYLDSILNGIRGAANDMGMSEPHAYHH